MALFRRKQADSLDPQYLMAQAQAQNVTSGFRLTVQDVFTIRGRGTVVTGRVETGSITNGAAVQQLRPDGTRRTVAVNGIEMYRKVTETASAGDHVGLLLRDLGRDDIGPGDVLTA
jgi:translation elongation factor EF-Tu-like GTPase